MLSAAIFYSAQSHALSLVFNAGECISSVDQNAPAPSYRLIESKFNLITDHGGGFYALELTGGLPRFSDNSLDVCIDNETSLGYIGFPKADNPDTFLPRKQDAVMSEAYFDGKTLVIFTGTIYTDRNGNADYTRNIVKSSMFVPVSRGLFFDYDAATNSFRLSRMLKSSGIAMSSTVSSPNDTYLEVVIPGFFETFVPKMDITYRLIND